MTRPEPTIKGLFVKSHIKRVQNDLGASGMERLRAMYGGPLEFSNIEDVPIREEVRIIECTLALLYPDTPKERHAFEAGRLHFQNFSRTSIGKLMFSSLPHDFKFLLLRAKYIAQHVFKHVTFTAVDLGPNSARIIMDNNDYPLEHFQGFFKAWMEYFSLEGHVEAKEAELRYEYTMIWK